MVLWCSGEEEALPPRHAAGAGLLRRGEPVQLPHALSALLAAAAGDALRAGRRLADQLRPLQRPDQAGARRDGAAAGALRGRGSRDGLAVPGARTGTAGGVARPRRGPNGQRAPENSPHAPAQVAILVVIGLAAAISVTSYRRARARQVRARPPLRTRCESSSDVRPVAHRRS